MVNDCSGPTSSDGGLSGKKSIGVVDRSMENGIVTPPKFNILVAPEKLPGPNRKVSSLPTTTFQGRTVSFREGMKISLASQSLIVLLVCFFLSFCLVSLLFSVLFFCLFV